MTQRNLEQTLNSLSESNSSVFKPFIREFRRYAPFRLLAPWIQEYLEKGVESGKDATIAKLSIEHSDSILYSIEKNSEGLLLRVNSLWADYLRANYAIIEGFWRASYIEFLQRRNPNVLAISEKLECPIERKLSEAKRLFREFYAKSNTTPKCFYSGVEISSISHDHYYPWTLLGHDRIWNIVPSSSEVNSSKGNRIPDDNRYLVELAKFHWEILSA